MQGYKKLLLTALLATFLIPLMGQNTDSPYSRYGYGVLNNQSVGAARSMGGISYGLRGLNTNPGNPASYTVVDSLTFIFDMGVNYSKSKLSENGVSQNDDNGGLDYLTMQFPLSRKLGMSIGLLPFSSVGYSFGTVEGQNMSSTKSFSGSGGFSQVYGGLAYEVYKNLSVGANISYIFGNTTYTRGLAISGVPNANGQSWHHKLTLNMLKFDFGAQYTHALDAKNNITVGAVFSPTVKTSGSIYRQYTEYTSSGTAIVGAGDTVTYRGNQAYTDLPNKFGAGFTWNRNGNLTVGADATYETWSKSRYSAHMDDDLTDSNRFNDRWRFNAGFEYTIDPRDRSFLKRMKFRGGLNYSNSYTNVLDNISNTSGYKEYGVTVGFGLPIRDVVYSGRTSYINIGFEYRNLSPEKSSLIKEQYYGVTLGVCFNELWFLKNKFR
ncbi:MAG: hypothetical protein E6772_14365 [Dysgonomonas sp.]|nr:hypothetical protein [Dysgonomonas sp.]